MNPKTLNLAAAAIALALILVAGFSLYERGKQAERAESAEQALSTLHEAYKRLQTVSVAYARADSAAEATRRAFREPVEPAITRFITLVDTLAFTDTLIVEAAQEAVTTCSFALLACEVRVSTADSLIRNQASQIRNLEAQLAATRAVAEAACDGRVPTWTLPVAGLIGAGAGAWIRGN
jgi:hypothetical protein